MAAAAPTEPGSNLDRLINSLTVAVQNQEHSALHDAVTFSRLLCVNSQLRSALLPAATGRLQLALDGIKPAPPQHGCLVRWVLRHLRLRTLVRVVCMPQLLAVPLIDYESAKTAGLQVAVQSQALLSRIACVLADAASSSDARVPHIDAWFAHELLPATLSQLPGDHLTQLLVTADQRGLVCWEDVARLTSLRDLRMPVLNPPPAVLATVFTSLTRLTSLLMVEARPDVSRSIPASLQELVLVHNDAQVYPVRLAHLTNLQRLVLGRYMDLPAGWPRHDDADLVEFIYAGGALPPDAKLPTSLRRLSIDYISSPEPLANLKQLDCIEFCHYPHDHGMAHEFMRLEHVPETKMLTRLQLTQHPGSLLLCFLDIPRIHGRALEELGKRLFIQVPHLSLQVPRTACDDASINLAFSVLGRLTTLTSLQLNRERGRRAAAILTAAAAAGGNGVGQGGAWNGTVDQLAAALRKLTNLKALELNSVAWLAGDGPVGTAQCGADYLPVLQAIGALPKLQLLRLEAMPLGVVVPGSMAQPPPAAALAAAAQHLTSLSLSHCRLDTQAVVALVERMHCKTCLRCLTWTEYGTGFDVLQDAALLAISQHLTQLTKLLVAGPWFSAAAVASLSRLHSLKESNVQVVDVEGEEESEEDSEEAV